MEWTQTLTIIGVFAAFFIYLISKMDGVNTRLGSLENRMTGMEAEIKGVNQRIETEIKGVNQRIDGMNQRITDLKTDVNQRLSTIESYLAPKKVFHFEEPKDDPKEN